jgi:DNA mismatch endonuclease, patch repair protein
MMARVRSKDSKGELALRRALHARGVRYRLHASDVTGCPDVVIRKYRLAIFMDGDFWHGNAWRLRGLPSLEAQFPTHTEWWTTKIRRNIERDEQVNAALRAEGWHVLRFWESDVLRDPEAGADRVLQVLHSYYLGRDATHRNNIPPSATTATRASSLTNPKRGTAATAPGASALTVMP